MIPQEAQMSEQFIFGNYTEKGTKWSIPIM